MTSIVFLDPYPVVRLGFEQILGDAGSGVCIESVYSVDEMAGRAKQLDPDLLIVTINSPRGQNPVGIFKECRAIYPKVPIVFFDEEHLTSDLHAWIRPDVAGYISKCESADILRQCVQVVLGGGKYLSPRGWVQYLGKKDEVI